jgi:hypothetical protein
MVRPTVRIDWPLSVSADHERGHWLPRRIDCSSEAHYPFSPSAAPPGCPLYVPSRHVSTRAAGQLNALRARTAPRAISRNRGGPSLPSVLKPSTALHPSRPALSTTTAPSALPGAPKPLAPSAHGRQCAHCRVRDLRGRPAKSLQCPQATRSFGVLNVIRWPRDASRTLIARVLATDGLLRACRASPAAAATPVPDR